MKRRNSWGRRLMFLFLLAVGPLSIGCEAILDFDRTPLQPVVEASIPDASPPPDSSKKEAAGDDDDDMPKDSGKDTSAPKDAGKDGDADQ